MKKLCNSNSNILEHLMHHTLTSRNFCSFSLDLGEMVCQFIFNFSFFLIVSEVSIFAYIRDSCILKFSLSLVYILNTYSFMHAQSHLTPWSHGLQLTRLLCLWNSPGKNTGVGCYFLLQEIFPDPGIKPGSPALQTDTLPSTYWPTYYLLIRNINLSQSLRTHAEKL